ncbi:uncharacterized protein AlkB isoform X5 [Drosophila virilis]|uniref:uncharacterized protein AlkB isoform X5 n=1 Tax=Drosophila virilis TaxID=7244 RepID=UPI001395EEDD|nr:uncharacterized protein LOC6636874 isoform X6 [Drosophila virilis]
MKQTIPLTVGVIFLLLCITASSSIRLSLPNMASNDFKLAPKKNITDVHFAAHPANLPSAMNLAQEVE